VRGELHEPVLPDRDDDSAAGPAHARQSRSGLVDVGAGVFVALLFDDGLAGAPAHEYTRTQSTCSRTLAGVPAW